MVFNSVVFAISIATAGLEAGAVLFADLSRSLPDERFRDLRHADERGADIFTRLVADELREAGI